MMYLTASNRGVVSISGVLFHSILAALFYGQKFLCQEKKLDIGCLVVIKHYNVVNGKFKVAQLDLTSFKYFDLFFSDLVYQVLTVMELQRAHQLLDQR